MGAVLGIAGGTTSGFGGLMDTKAQVEAMRYNRKLQNFQAELAADDAKAAASTVASSNVVAIAKSGVRREGSPLEVLVNNAYNEERNASLIRAGVQIQADLLTQGARNAQISGIVSASASVLGGASQAASSIKFGSDKRREGENTATFSAGAPGSSTAGS
jgi:hypothetical protein